MTRGAFPWSDPAVDAGFAAAYDGQPLVQPRVAPDAAPLDRTAALHDAVPVDEVPGTADAPVPTVQDDLDEQRDVASRPLTRGGRRARATPAGRLSPARALAGAAVSVAGVLLGIGTLLWVSEDPGGGPGPVVQAPVDETALDETAEDPALDAFATAPEAEAVPVDPSPVPPPVASTAPAPPAPPAPAAAAPAPARTAARSLEVPVTVLNNSRITGLADRAAARFEAGGWPVAKTGNFRGTIPSTTVYYERGQEASARAFARRFDGIVRVRPRFATLPARGLVVVVTRDFAR